MRIHGPKNETLLGRHGGAGGLRPCRSFVPHDLAFWTLVAALAFGKERPKKRRGKNDAP